MRRSLLVCLAMLFFTAPAQALDEADRGAIHDVITKQMESFKADDAVGAFSFAAPGIQRIFRDADTFMAMVRSGYAPVYRPRSTSFGELSDSEAGIMQTVTIVDGDGNFWTAVYTMEKGDDGQWRISGCRILKAPSA
jgi:Domain of unknown function (DUF4864)